MAPVSSSHTGDKGDPFPYCHHFFAVRTKSDHVTVEWVAGCPGGGGGEYSGQETVTPADNSILRSQTFWKSLSSFMLWTPPKIPDHRAI